MTASSESSPRPQAQHARLRFGPCWAGDYELVQHGHQALPTAAQPARALPRRSARLRLRLPRGRGGRRQGGSAHAHMRTTHQRAHAHDLRRQCAQNAHSPPAPRRSCACTCRSHGQAQAHLAPSPGLARDALRIAPHSPPRQAPIHLRDNLPKPFTVDYAGSVGEKGNELLYEACFTFYPASTSPRALARLLVAKSQRLRRQSARVPWQVSACE